jgi:1-pyrroline-5-carboxylate dehydrogenase
MLTAQATLQPFSNEPIRSFTDPADQAAMEAALAKVRAQLGRRYPLIIGGQRIDGDRTIPSVNPANP